MSNKSQAISLKKIVSGFYTCQCQWIQDNLSFDYGGFIHGEFRDILNKNSIFIELPDKCITLKYNYLVNKKLTWL